MNAVIKERINQVRCGKVPEGYRHTKGIGVTPVGWPLGKMEDVLHNVQRPVPKPGKAYWRLGLRSHAKGTFHELVEDPDAIKMDELYEVNEDDLVVNITFAWEHAIALAGKEDEGMLVSHRFPTYVFNDGNSPQFYKAMVTQKQFKGMLENISPGGAGRNRVMSKPAFLKLTIAVPPSTEQKKIAEILTHCDKVIDLKEQLIEGKRRRKKWLMQKLLHTDSGISLPGFEGSEWISKPLKQMCSIIIDGDWIESKDQSDKGIRLIQTGNIGIGVFIEKAERARYIDDVTFMRLKCNEVFPGDILISRLPDPIGRACMIPNLNYRTITAVDCSIVRFKNPNEARFFIQYSCTDNYFKAVSILSGGSTRTRISRKELEKLPVSMPKKSSELTAISEVLFAADREIYLLEQELVHWQLKKKSLMQLLLTGIVRV
ncbi:MAG: restriction endonuclease subunit S [Dehalococcoides mccartyi]|uniref:restriction endonuclease subunit S n=1 Tax=Dehalococcoides mccartyi TaxID=61435 RepID=UPI0030FD15D2